MNVSAVVPMQDNLNLKPMLDNQRRAFHAEGPVALSTRIDRLNRCIALLVDNKDLICDAVSQDFGSRSPYVTLMTDVMTSLNSLKFVRKKLKKWMKPERRSAFFPMNFLGGSAQIRYQPKGVVGIMTPWNVPVNMIFSPLADVIGAGNRAMIKPSEFTPNTSALMKKLFSEYFEPSEITVVTGGADVGKAFGSLPFDHIIFTGAGSIGRLVMRAAAENLVPVTLELGGKSPVVVSRDCDINQAAAKIISGKSLNGGQLCVSPDYCFVPSSHLEVFIRSCKETIAQQFPVIQGNPDFTAAINEQHFDRVKNYIDEAKASDVRVEALCLPGDEFSDRELHKIALHLIVNPSDALSCMQDEIFGAILNIKTYEEIDEAIQYINSRERPLAMYYFGDNKQEQNKVINETLSGGVSINSIAMHVNCDDMPFGGVGHSGMGSYRGREGFKTFSHARSIYRDGFVDLEKLGGSAPPYGDSIANMLESQIKK